MKLTPADLWIAFIWGLAYVGIVFLWAHYNIKVYNYAIMLSALAGALLYVLHLVIFPDLKRKRK